MSNPSPKYVADFDSASAMMTGLGRFLNGRDFPALGNPLYEPLRPLAGAINAIPKGSRERIYTFTGATEGIPPDRAGTVDGGAISRWVTGSYPQRPYPAMAIGSSSGALVHLWRGAGHSVAAADDPGADPSAGGGVGPGGGRPNGRHELGPAGGAGGAGPEPGPGPAPHARPGAGPADDPPDDLLPPEAADAGGGVRAVHRVAPAARRDAAAGRVRPVLADGPRRRPALLPVGRVRRARPRRVHLRVAAGGRVPEAVRIAADALQRARADRHLARGGVGVRAGAAPRRATAGPPPRVQGPPRPVPTPAT